MDNDQSYVERYCLGLLVEEVGEALCHIGRAYRFGLDSPEYITGCNSNSLLHRELGDIKAAIKFACMHKLVNSDSIAIYERQKLAKLLDESLEDNLGRPLAPQP